MDEQSVVNRRLTGHMARTMVNRRLTDKLLASIAKDPQSMIFTPKFNTFANGNQ